MSCAPSFSAQHESVHDKFSATKSLFYCLVRLNVLILHSHKDTLLVRLHLGDHPSSPCPPLKPPSL